MMKKSFFNENKLWKLCFYNEESKSKEIQGKNVLSFTQFVLGGFCLGGFVWGVLSGGFLAWGFLSREVLLGGLCPGGFSPVTQVLEVGVEARDQIHHDILSLHYSIL